MLQSDPSPADLAEKTIDTPPELYAAAFAVAGEDQEKMADEQTLVLLKRFSRNPNVEKAWAEFEHAQNVEEQFHKDFDGVDLTSG
jgi:hypothetical protein